MGSVLLTRPGLDDFFYNQDVFKTSALFYTSQKQLICLPNVVIHLEGTEGFSSGAFSYIIFLTDLVSRLLYKRLWKGSLTTYVSNQRRVEGFGNC